MFISIPIPDFAFVTVLGIHRRHALSLINKLDGHALLSSGVSQPTELKREVLSVLNNGYSGAIFLKNSHTNLRMTINKMAKTAGAKSILIQIDQNEEIAEFENFDAQFHIASNEIDNIQFVKIKMPFDRTDLEGPFDIIGDIHGCAFELRELLIKLGHALITQEGHFSLIQHPESRRLCFLGDLTDRGPNSHEVLNLVMSLQRDFGALVVLGNHDYKLMRWLEGNPVHIKSGLKTTVSELAQLSQLQKSVYAKWLRELPTHLILSGGKLLIAHAGLAEKFHHSASAASRAFALYGSLRKQSERGENPLRLDWAADYHGSPTIVHGHVVRSRPRILNNVVSIDTGCVFGGKLTAYRFPEGKFVSVAAHRAYAHFHLSHSQNQSEYG